MASRYSQLAWQNSNKIGCGVYWCSTMTFAACEYNPAGNQVGSTVYEKGDPCTKDSDCHCDGCVCLVDEALCLKK
ncbi:hypothetical protein TELCIR_09867 [Teladorsagia circumcincta]|uniref:SCP domain-containing protein n=1 Tax=Teladorsagia circumcincta TaxID=45464 RepID=A0A2G9UDP1_TELCI|nr:hypothetical protein TELCIR_09867 [Teladorsagia circumcincta]